ncbi:DUF169 domain-containing protein [bacterium]|nr:DUF169 domain-containing protein [bacterium]
MNHIHHTFSSQFRGQWIKIKFYRENPDFRQVKRLCNVRFCEAVFKAIRHPVILDRKSIDCPGAQYVFGWQDDTAFLKHCGEKSGLSDEMLKTLLAGLPRFSGDFEYIGLNTEGEPDMIAASLMPKEVMGLIGLYRNKTGQSVTVSLSSMLSICGEIAVKTLLEEKMAVSFGCMDSRKYANLDGNRLVVGIPRKHFNLVQSR